MFEKNTEQVLSPTDEGYEMSAVDPETAESKGMSFDTAPAFRAMLDERERERKAMVLYEDSCSEESSPTGMDDMLALADRLNELRDRKKELDATIKALGKEIEETDQKLSEAMSENEVDKFSRNRKTFYLNTRLFASPLDGDREALFTALRENGYGDLITEQVNANTLSSFVKEQREINGGEEIPAWIGSVVNVYEKTTVGIRKN